MAGAGTKLEHFIGRRGGEIKEFRTRKRQEETISRNGVLKGSILEEEDTAQAALFLASDGAKYVSGVNLPVINNAQVE
ncbi:hypothetical protein Goari_018727 [Gossypium aridum]|uniref:Uncharacterized protein n=1 Tax=Gossypium aridum TaxID=34290 RepID=A0A7J8WQW5_GOSAI|nr:hypothetical protein [Gossypium aridum]